MTVAHLARRAGWGVGDQALSSLTNFLLGILVARSVSIEALGAFGLAFATYTVFLNIARSIGTQPLVVRFSGPADDRWHRAVGSATALAIATGVVGSLVCAVIAAIGGGATREAFLALALTMPGLLLQDAWRFSFFAVARGKAAFANDLVWAVVMIPLVVWISAMDGGILALILAWGGAATIAGLYGLRQSGVWPEIHGLGAWWRSQRDIAVKFTAESLVDVLSNLFSLYALAYIVNLAAVGALRAGQLLVGPVNIVLQGVQLVALPEAVGAAGRGNAALVRVLRLIGVVLVGIVGTFGLVLLLMPDALGEVILGDNWAAAKPVLLPVIVGRLAISGTYAFHIGLLALAAAGRSLRATVITSVMTLAFGVAGAVIGSAGGGEGFEGAVGAAWGLAIAGIVGLGVFAIELRAGLADPRRAVPRRTTA